jgi:HD-GYP domain-containing protein (c-di-GMP phosphodiesterase class II)
MDRTGGPALYASRYRALIAAVVGLAGVVAISVAIMLSSASLLVPGLVAVGASFALLLGVPRRAPAVSSDADASSTAPEVPPAAEAGERATSTEPEPAGASCERHSLRMPATLDPEVVAMALLESACLAGEAVAVHIWLEDPASGTLRLIAAVGAQVPTDHPRSLDDDPLGLAITGDRAMLASVPAADSSGSTSALWRFAMPMQAHDARGVTGIDFATAEQPDMARLVEITALLRASLTGALALFLAKKETDTARMLIDTARVLTRRLDADAVVEHALSRAMALSEAATGSVMLPDPETGELRITASRGLSEDVVRSTRVRPGEGIAGWVLVTGEPVLVEDLPGNERTARRPDVRSAMSVPIADEDGILGVLNVGGADFPARFTDSHLESLRLLGGQAAVALRNARALTSARELYFATLRAFALAVETKDPYAHGSTERVLDYTLALGREMRLDAAEMQSLEIAALLHDIAMSSAGDAVVTSGRPLSTFERGLLKLHPVLAAEILEEVPALENVIPIVYHHHEWYDGRGYVVGLAGEDIPLGSRILAVADAWVAMTSDRPYRSAMSPEAAMAELRANAGKQFDPDVVRAFEEVLARTREASSEAR